MLEICKFFIKGQLVSLCPICLVEVSGILVLKKHLLILVQNELFQYLEVKMRFDHVLNVHHSINLLLALLEHLAFPLEVISDLGQDLGEGLRCEQRLES